MDMRTITKGMKGMDDLISRQAAIDEIDKLSDEPIGYLEAAIDTLADLPSAQPERKTGQWIKAIDELGEAWSCSECMTEYTVDEMNAFLEWANYCPNCGADMRERREE